jgi:hypothetical protein
VAAIRRQPQSRVRPFAELTAHPSLPPRPAMPSAYPPTMPRHKPAVAPPRIVITIVEGRIIVVAGTDPADPPSRPTDPNAPASVAMSPGDAVPSMATPNSASPASVATPSGAAVAPACPPHHAAPTPPAHPHAAASAAAASDLHYRRVNIGLDCHVSRAEAERCRLQRHGSSDQDPQHGCSQ